jgi:hypothetical protein
MLRDVGCRIVGGTVVDGTVVNDSMKRNAHAGSIPRMGKTFTFYDYVPIGVNCEINPHDRTCVRVGFCSS